MLFDVDVPLLTFKFAVAIKLSITVTSLFESLELFAESLLLSFKYLLLEYPIVPSLNLTLYHPELSTPSISTVSFFLIYPIFSYFVEPPILTFTPQVATSFLPVVGKLFEESFIVT
ncbi:hypothetical protein SDC9_186656 [bioreactor metagenome]|uniref:Uncharacterized protein n=1 Tax=bioreactor metagenome TaxID=1076179 RepID=A0A645HLK9_9ZZZZ